MGQHKCKKDRDGIICTASERQMQGDVKPKKLSKRERDNLLYRELRRILPQLPGGVEYYDE